MDGGCPLNIDCKYASASADPIASTADPSNDDVYDACMVDGLAAAGFPDAWVGQLLKGQAKQEGGAIIGTVDTNTNDCGGLNCGMWAISAGKVSGDTAPTGVCGVAQTDPVTGAKQDNSHSYALFQDTPGCEGTFLVNPADVPKSGYMIVGTGTADVIPWNMTQKVFYAESETSIGVMNLTGQTVSGIIDAVMDPTDTWYGRSIFNPAYNMFVHMGYSFKYQYQQAQGTSTGCDKYQMMFKTIAYWLNGDISNDCKVPPGGAQGGNLKYVQDAINYYKTMYGKAWPYEMPQ
jgi:hypothetical protein